MTALERFKTLAGIAGDTQDGLISVLLSDAGDAVCDYIGRGEVPERLVSVQVQLNDLAEVIVTALENGGFIAKTALKAAKKIQNQLQNRAALRS